MIPLLTSKNSDFLKRKSSMRARWAASSSISSSSFRTIFSGDGETLEEQREGEEGRRVLNRTGRKRKGREDSKIGNVCKNAKRQKTLMIPFLFSPIVIHSEAAALTCGR
jgi:hypothetical protein